MNCHLITFEDMLPEPFHQQRRLLFQPKFACWESLFAHWRRQSGRLWLYRQFASRERETFADRRNIRNWLNNKSHANSKDNQRHNHATTLCGTGTYCPALAESRCGFHVRGDSWSSNRLVDNLGSGTIPLCLPMCVNTALYHPGWIGGRNFFFSSMHRHAMHFFIPWMTFLNQPPSVHDQKQRLVHHHRNVWDHTPPP